MTDRTFWQQAAGDKDRDFAALCLRWDVILNGFGSAGKWPDCESTLREWEVSPRKITDIRRFATEMADGDVVVLRLGTSKVVGVGVVVGDYFWSEHFADVDGWDLQHARRVRWLWSGLENPKEFPTYELKLGDPTQRLDSVAVTVWIQSLKPHFDDSRRLARLPNDVDHRTTFEEIADQLFDSGVSTTSIDSLSREIDELIRIAKWYQTYDDPSESETVAYLAIPLLRALGWTPQRMAIEWNRVDVALFKRLPRSDETLSVVVEAKKKGRACLTALSQAQAYAESRKNCRRLIVTDGIRYGVYRRSGTGFRLTAYLNLTDFRAKYAIHKCGGAYDAIRDMTPEGVMEI